MKYPSSPFSALLAAAAAIVAFAIAPLLRAQPVTIAFSHVADPGNAADTTGFGSVPYTYDIGTYFVTVTQYATFLNSVATTADTYGLYDSEDYDATNHTGIMRSGSGAVAAPYVYTVAGTSGNDPMTYTSWLDSARFCNWLHNGQPSGAGETTATTEEGAYTLDGDTQSGGESRNPYAAYWIPSEDEWYKAAYYSQALNSGTGGYWTYATRSDTPPGNTVGSGINEANYFRGTYCVTGSATTTSTVDYLTPVGSFPDSSSYYGTYDQSGDVYEWTDGLTFPNNNGAPERHVRGGAWYTGAAALTSTSSILDAAHAIQPSVGFRVATNRGPTVTGTAVGKFTLLLTSTDTSPTVPSAPGFATLVTTAQGGAILAGKLPDGESFSVTGLVVTVSGGGEFEISKALAVPSAIHAGAKGGIVGSIIFQQLSGSDIFGELKWTKPAQARGAYPAAINTNLNITGALFTPPAPAASVLPGFTKGLLTLTDTNGLSLSGTAALSSSNSLIITGTDSGGAKAAISTSTGILSGSFIYPGQAKTTTFEGVIIQDQKMGQGLFLGPHGSGTVTLQ